jgi:hypothetical protein
MEANCNEPSSSIRVPLFWYQEKTLAKFSTLDVVVC